jgi:predicted  nucleic acid-binding Zn-ribbon protein
MSFVRRWQRAALVAAALLVTVLMVTAVTCTAAEGEDAADPYAYLEMLDEADLRKMLFDKTHGRVQLDAFRHKADLVAAVRQLEEREDQEAQFDARVAAALARKAEAEKEAPKSTRGTAAAALALGENNNNRNNHNNGKKVVQLLDEEEDQTAAAAQWQARPAAGKEVHGARQRSGASAKASHAKAKHTLEVLYCTG